MKAYKCDISGLYFDEELEDIKGALTKKELDDNGDPEFNFLDVHPSVQKGIVDVLFQDISWTQKLLKLRGTIDVLLECTPSSVEVATFKEPERSIADSEELSVDDDAEVDTVVQEEKSAHWIDNTTPKYLKERKFILELLSGYKSVEAKDFYKYYETKGGILSYETFKDRLNQYENEGFVICSTQSGGLGGGAVKLVSLKERSQNVTEETAKEEELPSEEELANVRRKEKKKKQNGVRNI